MIVSNSKDGAEGPGGEQLLVDIALGADLETQVDGPADTPAPKDFLSKVERAIRIVSVIVVTAAACLAVWQYFESNRNKRLARSWDIMSEWKDSQERAAYARLGSAIKVYIADNVGALPSGLTDDQVRGAKNNIGQRMVASWEANPASYPGDWEADLREVIDFYNEIEFCVASHFCDAPLLAAYFSAEIRGVWDYFEPYALDQRATFFPQFAVATERLLKTFEE